MNYIKYTLILFLLIASFTAKAQTYQKVVFLKNGNILKGQVFDENETTLKVEILGGSVFVVNKADIIKMEKEKIPKQFRGKGDYIVKTNGYYHTLNFAFLFGQNQWSDLTAGASIQYTFGYQYNQWLGLGVGVGADSYFFYDTENIYPIYLEARGYFNNKPFSPYYSVQTGYGIAALQGDNFTGMLDAKGGLYLHPKIGFRFPSRSNVAFTLEVGYNMQKATYRFNNWQGEYEDALTFHRTSIRFGLTF